MPAPMDYSAHELHDPSRGATIQGNDSTDVMALQNMLAAVSVPFLCMLACVLETHTAVPHIPNDCILTYLIHTGGTTRGRTPAR